MLILSKMNVNYIFLVAATEWMGVSKRSWGTCITQLFSSIGQCILAGVIYCVRDWRVAQLITAAPLAVLVIYIWCVCSKSLYSVNELLLLEPSCKWHFWSQWIFSVLNKTVQVLWFVYRFIPESARWLLSRGKKEEAQQLIAKAAAFNKRSVPDSLLDKVRF